MAVDDLGKAQQQQVGDNQNPWDVTEQSQGGAILYCRAIALIPADELSQMVLHGLYLVS